jgi:hypothetical protein
MRIDINNLDKENFLIKENLIAGERCFLVQPNHVGTKFTQQNKHFRSSVWNSEGLLVSAGLPKFKNWLEDPENFPLPNSLQNTTATLKIDGSSLILSRYKNQTIHRTRGTFDATNLDNGHEINTLKQKYPKVFDFGDVETSSESFIYEWVSSENRIILDYGVEPDIYLIGIINHLDYSLVPQIGLDIVANQLGVKRPETHYFKDIPDMLETVKEWKDKEGICLYSNKDQQIHKIKCAEYLILHHFKSNATLENTIDLFCEYNYPSYQDFEQILISKFDFECWKMIQGFASNVCDSKKEVDKIIESMQDFLDKRRDWQRKDLAKDVISSYGSTNRAAFLFTLQDKKKLEKDNIKKLIWQVLKK